MLRFNPIKIEDTETAFPLQITKSQAKGKQLKALPTKFVKRFLVPQKPKFVVLVDEDGIETECHLLWKNIGENICHLEKGWYEFVRRHGLMETDQLLAIPNKDGTVLHIFVQNGGA